MEPKSFSDIMDVEFSNDTPSDVYDILESNNESIVLTERLAEQLGAVVGDRDASISGDEQVDNFGR